ncbi:putative alpha-l-rhamnosidase a [Diaporthe ampelina]|uniref:Putative alpha-l-rhamnosidase a n=1 Tax=Diaporthe ampelina TaxID=1214573 RepID=A0A0G2FL30_9PEZI|nr:putative alpha-l-rhamnosidase a [Diaporthe ampelina]
MTVGQETMGDPPENKYSWWKYIRGPFSTTIPPARLLSKYTSGNISNPDGIVNSGGVTTLTRNGPNESIPSLVLDFGRNYAGVLTIDFAGAEPSGQGPPSNTMSLPGITLAFSETLQFLTNRSDFTRSDNQPDGEKFTNGTDQIAVQKQPYTWTNKLGCQFPDDRKVCSDGFHGFRYLRISLQALDEDAPYTTGFGSVSVSGVKLAYSGFIGTPDTFKGYFECSNATLNQWWYDGVYTNDLATDVFRANDTEPRDAYTPGLVDKLVLHDGAKRDRDPYVGDLAVSAMTLYVSHGDPTAARNVLADLADHQREDGWIPPASIRNYTLPLFDYPLWWVVCTYDLVMYRRDTDYLDKYYPNMAKVLDVYYPNCTNADGLLEKGLGNSAGYGDYAFLPRTGVITYYNALYIMALKRAAQLAEFRGQDADAARWQERAEAIGPALLEENWDSSVGAFFDGGPCPGGHDSTKCPVHAQDGNSLAILADVGDWWVHPYSIMEYLDGALRRPYGNAFYDSSALSPDDQFDQRVYAFVSYFELAARFLRDSDTAFEELQRLYGWMAAHDPASTFWEGIGPGGRPYQDGFTSMAHGWSSGVTPLLTNYVLGLRPLKPGFAAFLFAPCSSWEGMDWARGQVDTPGGPIWVQWTRKLAVFSMEVSAPEGTSGDVVVLLDDGRTRVTMNGQVVWTKNGGPTVEGVNPGDGKVVVTVQGGSRHVIEAE